MGRKLKWQTKPSRDFRYPVDFRSLLDFVSQILDDGCIVEIINHTTGETKIVTAQSEGGKTRLIHLPRPEMPEPAFNHFSRDKSESSP